MTFERVILSSHDMEVHRTPPPKHVTAHCLQWKEMLTNLNHKKNKLTNNSRLATANFFIQHRPLQVNSYALFIERQQMKTQSE